MSNQTQRLSSVCRELTEQRDDFKKELEITNLRLKGKRHPDDNGLLADGEIDVKALIEQRDRLAEALREVATYDPSDGQCNSGYSCKYIAEQALQSLTKP